MIILAYTEVIIFTCSLTVEHSKSIIDRMNKAICRHCGNDNAYIDFKDENSKRFHCLDCDYEWETTTLKTRIKKIFSIYKLINNWQTKITNPATLRR